MSSIAEKVSLLVDQRILRINTILIGSITAVTNPFLVDVRLSHQVGTSSPQLLNVPVLHPQFGGSSVVICPQVGDMVVVGITKHERDPLLSGKTNVQVNPYRNFSINNAVVLSGTFTSSATAPSLVAGEMLLQHTSGSFIRFHNDGTIEIHSPVGVNVTYP
jgi:hypothetical protein